MNCPKCNFFGLEDARQLSWFTGQLICSNCQEDERLLKIQLTLNGFFVNDYADCGFVPDVDELKKDMP